ncbi:MAG: ABC transporter substrate-binding protein, partial [Candidatus Omnitrophica bacterium]|nr:ABC transporter substrate-binding protein [Candidatus Omnitrophota bacterium]
MQRVLFIFLILMMPISISAKSNNSAKSKEVYGGTLIWGICYKPTIINPLITTHSISMSLLDLIFNRLVRLNSKGEVSPDLAHSWNISGDGLIYTFYLRKGIKFHDGKECTAFDVKFTFEGILDDKNNSPFKSSFDLVKEFKVINPYVFRIILKAPSASFIYRLVQREIVPRHFFEDENSSTTNFNYHPIGTGPFKFKEWTREDRIILEYNPDYYEGRPYLDRIIVKTYEDARGLWFSLMCGAVDFTLFLEREDYEILKDDPSFRAYSFPCDGYYALVYNLNDPVLADNKIRKAIAYGIDKENLTNRAAFGYGLECSAPFSSQSLGFYPDRETF